MIGLILTGCATTTPISDYRRPLCVQATPVTVDGRTERVQGIFDRLWAVAAPMSRIQDVGVVIVRTTAFPIAGVCRQGQRATILLTTQAVEHAASLLMARDRLIAHWIAHELGHVIGNSHHVPGTAKIEIERTADRIGIELFERAGYDCRWLVKNLYVFVTPGDPYWQPIATQACDQIQGVAANP